jgi:iron complex transport system substrate-binding protein
MRRAGIGLAVAIGLVIGGVSLAWASAVTVVDTTGRTVTIPQPVTRVVSCYGISTYYLYALGAGDRVVEGWYVQIRGLSQAPEALRRMEPDLVDKLSFGTPNLEEIVSRHPDLVLTNPEKDGDLAQRLTALGIPALQYSAETPQALEAAMLLTGEALGTQVAERARAFASYEDQVLSEVQTALSGIPEPERVRVYFCGSSPLRVASGDMYQSRMIAAAGGVSVSAKLKGYWNDINLEQALVWKPDVIIITAYGGLTVKDILDNPDWQAVPAVKAGRVYKMPSLAAAWDTPVPDSVLGILWLAQTLYPGQVHVDLAAQVRSFYKTFYGYTVTDGEVSRLLRN